MKLIFFALVSAFLGSSAHAEEAAPCGRAVSLIDALGCVRANEPAFRTALESAKEAKELENSAYRLINPDLSLEYLNGNSLGDVQREASASLLFTLELGGKRSARAAVFNGEGLALRADAFEQRITALTELGGAILRLNQLKREKAVLEESANTFQRIIRLYRSRGQLPPEQRVSLNAFELITLDYSRKILETEAELLRFQVRTQRLFGAGSDGQPLDVSKFLVDLKAASKSLDEWIESTPEMLRLRSEQRRAEGELAVARAEMWPDLKIGPSVRQVTAGPISYQAAGITVSFPIPLLTWNGALRTSRGITAKRVQARTRWESQDVRAQYVAKLAQLDKIANLLRQTPSEADIQRKHETTESFFSRGLVGGALIIEAHRALVDYYETKHSLERQFLEDSLKIQSLASSQGEQ